MPKIVAGESSAKNVAGTAFGIVEIIGLLFLDLLVLFIIFGALGIIVMIVDFMQASWYEKIISFIGGITKLSWAGIQALMELFSDLNDEYY